LHQLVSINSNIIENKTYVYTYKQNIFIKTFDSFLTLKEVIKLIEEDYPTLILDGDTPNSTK